MKRKSENIEVRFGSQGSRELKQDLGSIATSLNKVKGAGLSMFDALKVGAGVEIFSGAFEAAVSALDLTSDQYVDSISRLSNVTGTSLEEMSRLVGVARRFGVDIDDLRGSMVQFYGQVAAAARGDSIAEEFEKIGISSQFLADNLEDPIAVLLAVAKAQQKLTGANRSGTLSMLFGEDDSVKVGEMLNALGSDSQAVADALGEIDASGAIVTQEDVKVNREFTAAMAEFDDVMRGLRLELARGILPTISKLTGATAGWLRENRNVVTGAILGGWERIGYAIQDVVDYLEGGREAIRGSWLYPVIGWAEGLGNAAGTTSRILGELFDELSGTRTTREFKWIDGLATGLETIGSLSAGAIDGAFAVIGGTAMGSLELLNQLPDAIAFVSGAWGEFNKGFSGTVTGSGLAELGGLFGDVVGWSIQLKDALEAIATGKPVDAQFRWVEQLIEAAPDLVGAIREVGNVGDLLRTVGENFDIIAALAVPVGTVGVIIVGAFGGAGIAVGVAAIALGVFIAKLAEAHDWMNVPFRAFDGFMREVTGMAEMDRDTLADIKEMGDRWADTLDQRDISMGQVPLDTSALQQQLSAQAPVQIPAEFDIADLEGLVEQAQLQVSGAVAMSNFPGQISSAVGAADGAVRAAAMAVPGAGTGGVPVIIQVMPTGEEITVYAPDQNVAQQIQDAVAKAKRASATPGGMPFAGDK